MGGVSAVTMFMAKKYAHLDGTYALKNHPRSEGILHSPIENGT